MWHLERGIQLRRYKLSITNKTAGNRMATTNVVNMLIIYRNVVALYKQLHLEKLG